MLFLTTNYLVAKAPVRTTQENIRDKFIIEKVIRFIFDYQLHFNMP